MATMRAAEPTAPVNEADLATCDREPIRRPGTIQPHGLLLVLSEPDLVVARASRNAAALLHQGGPIGRRLAEVAGPALVDWVRRVSSGPAIDRSPLHAAGMPIDGPGGGLWFDAIVHRNDGALILELEPSGATSAASFGHLYPLVRACLAGLERAGSVDDVCRFAAAEVRRIVGTDRVLIYRFDEGWHGTVVAEDGNGRLPSYLGLRFPASDIPAQARELYRANRTRLIADSGYVPVPIDGGEGDDGRPLDLSFSSLRSVSPVHVEYMRNMGTASSMSISILRDGELWGLISCHHAEPMVVPCEVRSVAEVLGQVLSLQVAAREQKEEYEHKIGRKAAQHRLLAAMHGGDDFVAALARQADDLLELVQAEGAAILDDGRCTLVGQTPSADDVGRIAAWLDGLPRDEPFGAESLARHMPDAEAFKDRACGLLAVPTSAIHRGYILWFRPEVIQTVRWGGDPIKATTAEGDGRVHPRHSFEAWKETVRLRAQPWRPSEIEAAVEFRNAVVNLVLRRAEERAQFVAELERSNKELEAFTYTVSHDLRAPFRHISGYAELLGDHLGEALDADGRRYLGTVTESAQFAGALIDNLLGYSRMGRAALHPAPIDMDGLAASIVAELAVEARGRSVRWDVGPLPAIEGDPVLIRMALYNLLANALKYSRTRDEAVIALTGAIEGAEAIFRVADNGIGFDMRYSDKLFGVFQRLHRMEDFEGTGIGLANVRRAVQRHGGRAGAEGAIGVGATFWFALPARAVPAEAR